MIYWEPYNIKKKIILSTPNKIIASKCEKLSKCYTCCGSCLCDCTQVFVCDVILPMRVKEDPKPSPKMSRKLKLGVSCFHA
jgi:hypothetical protein